MRMVKIGALVLLGVGLAGVTGSACSNRADDPALNGEGVHGSVPAGEMTGGGGGGTSLAGGGGTPKKCSKDADCTPNDAICGSGTCTSGECIFSKSLNSDVYGDCHKTVCDGEGKVVLVEDDTASNAYDDGNSCTTDKCMNGKPLNLDFAPLR